MADDATKNQRDNSAARPLAEVRTSVTDRGRVNQKLRTRQALIEAAREMVADGSTPTLADIAERALVSKTTAYRYFESVDALIEEVFFDDQFPTVDDAMHAAPDDPTQRVLIAEAAVNDALLANEHAMRVIVRNAIDRSLAAPGDEPRRIGRRHALIAAALEPVRGDLDDDQLERLRNALALVIGPEAIITTRDVCGLDPGEARDVTRWAAGALVARALADG